MRRTTAAREASQLRRLAQGGVDALADCHAQLTRHEAARERLRLLTLQMRATLDALEAAAQEAQGVLDEVETAAGLVDDCGRRFDEPCLACKHVACTCETAKPKAARRKVPRSLRTTLGRGAAPALPAVRS